MFTYAINVEYDTPSGRYMATCRDLPEMNSAGDDVDDALFESVDGLIATLSLYVMQRRLIPNASPARESEHLVYLPVLVVLKCALHNEMVKSGVKKSTLARQPGVNAPQIDRLLDVYHSSILYSFQVTGRRQESESPGA